MFEDDAILPDDFEATPGEETAVEQETVTPEAEDTKPAAETTETVQDTPKLKIKFNHEEREIPLDEAAVLAQKGLNYEKAVERAKQEARDAYVADQGHLWNGKPITTEAELKQARAEQELIEKYKDRDLPDELIDEIMAGRKDRADRQTEKQAADAKALEQKQFTDFADMYPGIDAKVINPETWLKAGFTPEGYKPTGTSLKHAYMEQERVELLSKAKVQEQNTKNQARAPVKGISTHGTGEVVSEDPFLLGFDSV